MACELASRARPCGYRLDLLKYIKLDIARSSLDSRHVTLTRKISTELYRSGEPTRRITLLPFSRTGTPSTPLRLSMFVRNGTLNHGNFDFGERERTAAGLLSKVTKAGWSFGQQTFTHLSCYLTDYIMLLHTIIYFLKKGFPCWQKKSINKPELGGTWSTMWTWSIFCTKSAWSIFNPDEIEKVQCVKMWEHCLFLSIFSRHVNNMNWISFMLRLNRYLSFLVVKRNFMMFLLCVMFLCYHLFYHSHSEYCSIGYLRALLSIVWNLCDLYHVLFCLHSLGYEL